MESKWKDIASSEETLKQERASPYNIIAIGCQEARHTRLFKSWLDACVKEYEESGYRLIRVVRMGSLSLVLLAAWWMVAGLQVITGTATKSIINRILGNKGATYIRLDFRGTRLLFVNCHFSAHQEKSMNDEKTT
ncbi:hypothetical protein BCR33DRAFT_218772 [Rhizoclosmatium globosum]|uniref:Inositol polyphosphate-related phosphatase domain-containing protein n=1 Tax=Rhizoclosmatium globosum TaxID=329046 RepID=A0A1Y2CB97_9FUNG|nr:hypothetical protein BCR33DRAFT_218772 [Rhizoclosmatium globosum]|eukprot:ORY44299.1 hypothetical protein BCR33DRAFT_218772 [Rhizoclosmatium globosum]